MTRFGLTAAALFACTAGMVVADPAKEIWQTQPDDGGAFGHVEMAPWGDESCGTLARDWDSSGKSIEGANLGKRIVWDMGAEAERRYGGGQIRTPDRDKTSAPRSNRQVTG